MTAEIYGPLSAQTEAEVIKTDNGFVIRFKHAPFNTSKIVISETPEETGLMEDLEELIDLSSKMT